MCIRDRSRLALWRMDSLLASMIAGENNRSPGEYFQGDALAEGGCRINPVKPRQCRDFPNKCNFPGWRDLCRAREVEKE